jgi:predicted nucleotidyltransferase
VLQKIDISDEHLKLVQDILKKYPYKFYVFGSRSKQQAKKFSDLDLCYFDNIDSRILSNIEEDFEESDLPYKVDIINFNDCSEDFKAIIKKDMVHLSH